MDKHLHRLEKPAKAKQSPQIIVGWDGIKCAAVSECVVPDTEQAWEGSKLQLEEKPGQSFEPAQKCPILGSWLLEVFVVVNVAFCCRQAMPEFHIAE